MMVPGKPLVLTEDWLDMGFLTSCSELALNFQKLWLDTKISNFLIQLVLATLLVRQI